MPYSCMTEPYFHIYLKEVSLTDATPFQSHTSTLYLASVLPTDSYECRLLTGSQSSRFQVLGAEGILPGALIAPFAGSPKVSCL